MKKFVLLAISFLTMGTSFAQNNTKTTKPMTVAEKKAADDKKAKADRSANARKTGAENKAVDARKNCVGGYVRTARYMPMEGIQAFIYLGDSANTIGASGYTDATGYYETNSVAPGTYSVKFVYPNNKSIMVSGVTLKRGITDISLKNDAPTADTGINYLYFAPKPVAKAKATSAKK